MVYNINNYVRHRKSAPDYAGPEDDLENAGSFALRHPWEQVLTGKGEI